MKKLGFLGAGNMGSAIIKGIAKGNIDAEVYVFDTAKEKVGALSEYVTKICDSEEELIENSDFILLAVKPQVLPDVLTKIGKKITAEKTVISICAGISEKFIRSYTYPDTKVILVMPNTPMMLGVGASAISKAENVSAEEFEFAKNVIASCGIAIEVPIDRMKEVIAINGSSPAFIYLYAKGFIDYAEKVGIDSDSAMKLFAQSLIGSAKMLTESGMTVAELIKQVSSPGGTTIAGLDKLYEGELEKDVMNCCEACTNRAYELAGEK